MFESHDWEKLLGEFVNEELWMIGFMYKYICLRRLACIKEHFQLRIGNYNSSVDFGLKYLQEFFGGNTS